MLVISLSFLLCTVLSLPLEIRLALEEELSDPEALLLEQTRLALEEELSNPALLLEQTFHTEQHPPVVSVHSNPTVEASISKLFNRSEDDLTNMTSISDYSNNLTYSEGEQKGSFSIVVEDNVSGGFFVTGSDQKYSLYSENVTLSTECFHFCAKH